MLPAYKLNALVMTILSCLAFSASSFLAQEDATWLAESIAMSPDGKYLSVKYGAHVEQEDRDETGYDSGVWVYDLDDHALPPRYLRGAGYSSTLVAISPDSRHVALSDYEGLQVFDLADLSPKLDLPRTTTENPTDFYTISFSADGQLMMSLSDYWATAEHKMSVWEVGTGSLVQSIPAVRAGQSWQLPKLSPDWRQFLDWWHPDGIQIYEFDVQQGLGSPLGVVSLNVSDVRGIAFSPDSSMFALVIPDGEIKLYRTDTWKLSYIQVLGEYSCGNSDVSLAFGHVNPWLIFTCHTYGCGSQCEWYGGLVVLDFETGAFLLIQNRAPSFDYITPDDGLLVGDNAGQISLWDTQNGFELSEYPGEDPQLHPNGELMTTIGPDGRVWLWNVKLKKLLEVLPVPQRQSY